MRCRVVVAHSIFRVTFSHFHSERALERVPIVCIRHVSSSVSVAVSLVLCVRMLSV